MSYARGNPQAGFNPLQSLILLTVALVLTIVVVSAYFSAQKKARDAQRVSDVERLRLAMKYYYEEFGYYPQASSDHKAVGVDNSFGKFVSEWPDAPKPADGVCNAEYNRYVYEQVNSGESYQIRFCLGQAVGKLKPGVRIGSPSGYQ